MGRWYAATARRSEVEPLPAAPWLRPAVPYETIIMNPAGGQHLAGQLAHFVRPSMAEAMTGCSLEAMRESRR